MPVVTASHSDTNGAAAARYDRQVRAFGTDGQRRLRQLTVAVVGAGGAGSLLVQGLAHLGIGRLLVVDPDRVEASNLNRLVGATPDDARRARPKVEVARRLATTTDPDLPVAAIRGDVLDPAVWRQLRAADVLLGAVDADAARWALNVLAVQHARCYLDVGVEITRHDDRVEVAGHLACVRPAGPCLRCLQGYRPTTVAAELDPALARAKATAGYLPDAPDEPAPSVLFLNQAAAAFALAELVNLVAPYKPAARYLLFDLTGPTMTGLDADPDPDCPVCGTDGIRGLGDFAGSPLPADGASPPPSPAPPVGADARPSAVS